MMRKEAESYTDSKNESTVKRKKTMSQMQSCSTPWKGIYYL